MPHDFRVLCAASEQWLSLAQVPRMLHRAGAHVTFLGPAGAWPLRGSFVDRWVRAEGKAEAVARVLGAHLTDARPYDWIILGDDSLLAAVGARRDEPWTRAALPLEPDDVRRGLLGSKLGFVTAAAALGLPIPRSLVCRGEQEIREALDTFDGPALIKEDGPSGGEGCHALTRTGAVPARLRAEAVVVQALVQGPTIAVEALYDRGQLRFALTSTIERTWPPPFGVSALRRFSHDATALALTEDLGRTVGIHGFANLTMLRDPSTGRTLLIELDLRPNALFHLGAVLGVDLTPSLRALLERRPPEPVRHLAVDVDARVPIYPVDVIRSVLQRDWRALASWLTDSDDRWRSIPPDDPRLARAYLGHIVRQIVRQTLRDDRAARTPRAVLASPA
ncbi:MAG TPA: hypothetical protein VGP07_00420 [Polyangia bacterium]|jgi:hypothetical protein